ncbi:hatching enzyme 1.2-like [Paramacrobiotus metropolitanus]|uniref:hatching enzyme 1.2-like n=1 Tax=Paramacrobiotus metropolitanus TaxID=2943436 RepID=UPI0024459C41|nr:hatching enzyme 1.2-like [Paramacrobiotus metropolitanus]
MCAISQKTCVTFYPRTTETDYVKIVNQLGCWSFVGRQGGRQLLSLQIAGANNRTCLTGTVVEHELMHTLGFVHEQSRLDRDTYIDIDLNNVDPAFQNNFLKYNRKFVVDVPYDTTSIMHYNSEAFALNLSLPVITRKNNASARISAAEIVSDLDYEKISSLYSCPQNTSLVLQPVIPAETVYSASPYTSTSCDPVEGSGISPPRGTDDATLTPDPTGADTCVLFGSGGGGGRG